METNNTSKIKEMLKNKFVKYGLLLFIGIFLGWVFFGRTGVPHSHDEDLQAHAEEPTVWTCAMHPQIKQDKPGKCPLCAMDLTPMRKSGSGDEVIDAAAIQMSPEAIALANVQTTTVSRQNPVKEVQLYGTIQADERLSQSQTSHVNGRIEQLSVNFTGETVSKGQTIATIYSPELLNAQQELIEAKKLEGIQPALIEAAREKLRLWKLSDEQIAEVERSGVAKPQVAIKANASGIVVEKRVNEGDYVNQGSVLFQVANLSQVWAMFDAYEVDLPFLKVGDKVEFTLQAIPNRTFSGQISFIDPILNKTTRTAKVRVVTNNPGLVLKPEMYANATIKAPLRQNKNQIVVPKSAVLWTGKRSVVYVKQPDVEAPAFMLREVDLGPSLGDAYVVENGLTDGEIIVTNGVFTIDASAQLEGKRSMMNDHVSAPVSGHAGHGSHGESHAKTNPNDEHAEIKDVQGLCEMCGDRIQKAAMSVAGVSSAHWDSKTKALHLNYDKKKTSIDAVSKAIAKSGHDVGKKYKADDKVYDALPGCCQYRK